ncbi:hypothetical protein [Actinoplanes teichomyceticus]|uniref:Uncharacterized protein n=1 Tax=Actinoplanes teichomyceticus TaxID=1867 RepID=A0A561VGL9_ACTTI|nr:hypothetical protein [Actinoplanes teichomyceticus]TWG10753.1 hypothetical protein FHX34_107249 [Actinoplanes teichomyceticus]GIF12623.1 hypothetical protein Ate01nite_26550 [Actinoplanes teichomyceticus]
MTAVEPTRISRNAVPEIGSFEPSWDEAPAVFRFPAEGDPAPGTARVLTMAGYTAMLGLTGAGVGLYAVIAVLRGAPGWYLPALALLTMLSVAPAVGAFLAVHRRALPWILLLSAAPPMAGALLLAVAY